MPSGTMFCVQQNYFLLPLSNKSLFLYRCVLDFDLTAVGLCLTSPGKELHSQLPSAANALSSTSDEHTFPVRPGLWTDILFLLDQPIVVQPSKPSCPSISRGSNCVMVHGIWKWRREKVDAEALRLPGQQQQVPALREAQGGVAQPFILGRGCAAAVIFVLL